MTSIRQQIQAQKTAKSENLKDLFYVDECNNCKDPEIRGIYGKDYMPCHHEWYCHHDGGKVEKLESEIGLIQHNINLRGYSCAYEIEKLKTLGKMKWELIKECRRNLPKIKHGGNAK